VQQRPDEDYESYEYESDDLVAPVKSPLHHPPSLFGYFFVVRLDAGFYHGVSR
jgi:hypothetical protein